MHTPLRALFVLTAVLGLLHTAPASANGYAKSAQQAQARAEFRAGQSEFRGLVRSNPKLLMIHAKSVAKHAAAMVSIGAVGGLAGATGASILSSNHMIVGGAALVAGLAVAAQVRGGPLGTKIWARTETVGHGVARGLIPEAKAHELERAGVISEGWRR